MEEKRGTILYIGGFELPDKNAAAQRVISNAKALRDLGYRVILVGIDRSLTGSEEFISTKSSHMGFEAYSIPYTNDRLISIERYKELLKRCEGELTHIILYNYPAIAFVKVLKYAHAKGIKVISDCTEWHEATGKNIIARMIKAADVWARMHVLNVKSDSVIAISKYLYNFYLNKVKTAYVPPLIDLTDEKWNRSACNENNEKVEFVYIGSPFGKDKIEEIADAFCKTKDHDSLFTVIGVTKEQFSERYPEVCERIDERVRFLGRLDHEKAIERLKGADFSIFYREIDRTNTAGFPTKFVEAITCGTPVITNISSDIGSYLVNGKNGFIIDHSILETLKTVLSRPHNELRKMKKNVDIHTFDYHKYLKDFEQVL